MTPTPPPRKGRHLYKHGLSTAPLYGRWRRMVQRCTDPATREFAHYGGRGIVVCERWHSFENFLADMGEPPEGGTLDRINTDGNYEPANCRWVPREAQSRNRRNNVVLTLNGESMCLAEWARRLSVHRKTLKSRIEAGWPVERVLSPQRFLNNGKAR